MIWKPAKLSREQTEERGMEGARQNRQGRLSQAEIARQLGVSRTAVKDWAQQLVAGRAVPVASAHVERASLEVEPGRTAKT